MSELVKLMDKREAARKNKDWAAADRIREELKVQGVVIYDKQHMWITSDGRKWSVDHAPGALPAQLDNVTSVTVSTAKTGGGADDSDITALVDAREKARHRKDFAGADALREQLKAVGVEIRDKEKIWKCSDGRIGLVPEWGPTGNDGEVVLQPQSKLNEAGIAMLLAERNQARSSKEWQRADQIRDVLKSMGVLLFDKEGIWKSNDGKTGYLEGGGAATTATATTTDMFAAFPGYTMDPATLAYFQAMQAWGALPGGMAAGLGAGMPTMTTAAAGMGTGMAGMGTGMTSMAGMTAAGMTGALTGAMQGGGDDIMSYVTQREMCRKNKDWAGADRLREFLHSMGVTLDDKAKTWTCKDGRNGTIPPYASFS